MQISYHDKNGELIKITESALDARYPIGHIITDNNKKYELFEHDYKSKDKYKKYKEIE